MKNFLSKNWKMILIIIAGIFICLNVFQKCIAPHTLVNEYAKYGPDVEAVDFSGKANNVVNQVSEIMPNNGSNDIVRIALILGVGLLIAVIISNLTSGKASSGKKKWYYNKFNEYEILMFLD